MDRRCNLGFFQIRTKFHTWHVFSRRGKQCSIFQQQKIVDWTIDLSLQGFFVARKRIDAIDRPVAVAYKESFAVLPRKGRYPCVMALNTKRLIRLIRSV